MSFHSSRMYPALGCPFDKSMFSNRGEIRHRYIYSLKTRKIFTYFIALGEAVLPGIGKETRVEII